MEFRVLGPLEVTDGAADLTPSAARLCAVLSLFLLRHNQPISANKLIQELWGESPPRSALPTLQTYVYRLRRALGPRVFTRSAGYVLEINPSDLDLCQFDELLREGKESLGQGRYEGASSLLSQAESLWRGPALDGVALGEVLSAHVTRIEESRLSAMDMRLDADLRLGRHRDMIGELKELTSTNPLHEGFPAMLMLALYRSGRRGEGLDAYQAMRATLIEHLGVEPSAQVRDLHQAMLRADTALELRPPEELRPRATVAQVAEPVPGPAKDCGPHSATQLPAITWDLVGRGECVAQVRKLLLSPPGEAAVVAIAGPVGVGKTAVALHTAHQLSGQWPDGQLFAPLGDTFRQMTVAQAFGHFLRALGMATDEVPTGLAARSAAFQRLTKDKAMLIVLDGVSSTDQIRSLVPGSVRSRVLVTYRGAGWESIDGSEVWLGALPFEESMKLLATRLGPRAAAERGPGLAAIAHLCEGLPLALCAVAERMLVDDQLSAVQLASELAEPQVALDTVSSGAFDLRARLDGRYGQLSSRDMSTFCLMSLLRSREFNSSRTAGVLGWDAEEAEQSLSRLARQGLLHRTRQVSAAERYYRYNGLVRCYAQERLEEILDDGSPPRAAAGRHPERHHLAIRLLSLSAPPHFRPAASR